MSIQDFPLLGQVEEIRAALSQHSQLLLEAPPGAGKTTGLPLLLLEEPWLKGQKLTLLVPRRIAVKAAAQRLARQLDETIGQRVGYRLRFEHKVGPNCRIEVMTYGIYIRALQNDPAASGAGLVLFDEFHERGLDMDLALALTLESQGAFRPELRILVMSATLSAAPLQKIMPAAKLIRSEGKRHPVTATYLARAELRDLPSAMAAAIHQALLSSSGDILAFLPGAPEIHRLHACLETQAILPPDTRLLPLFGDMSLAQQEEALLPDPHGRRRVFLATAIAETSLTIPGVEVVVDGGYSRGPQYDAATGMTHLVTSRVSQAVAAQRAGRAGRLGPGRVFRLWPEAEQRALLPYFPPEILNADLTSLVLELALWGAKDPLQLQWQDPPPAPHFFEAQRLLLRLGALEASGGITAHGRAMAELGAHPRLAHMLLEGKAAGFGDAACLLASLLEERDLFRRQDRDRKNTLSADLYDRFHYAVRHLTTDPRQQTKPELSRLASLYDQLRARLRLPRNTVSSLLSLKPARLGYLLAMAYPDRVARQRDGQGRRYVLANGRGAILAEHDRLEQYRYLVAAGLDGTGGDARIFLAAPIEERDLIALFQDRMFTEDHVEWDKRSGRVRAVRQTKLDALILTEIPLETPSPEAIRPALLQVVRQTGLGESLSWTAEVRQLQSRIAFLRRVDPEGAWPDLSEPTLRQNLEEWLAPFLDGVQGQNGLAQIPVQIALETQLSYAQRDRMAKLAPVSFTLPNRRQLTIDYDSDPPSIRGRLQDFFGCESTPSIQNGRIALMVHLLSPAGRPLQTTRDLLAFWKGSYAEVRKDMRGRYPKHSWPEDPLAAPPIDQRSRAMKS